MPYSPVKVNQSFRRKCHLHLQCWRVSHTRKHHEVARKQSPNVASFMLISCLPYSSTLKMEATCQLTFGRVHIIISQNTGSTRFKLGLGSWDFWHKLKQKHNGNICELIRFLSKIFSNQHKILEKCFSLWNLHIENCVMFNLLLKALHRWVTRRSFMSPTSTSPSSIPFLSLSRSLLLTEMQPKLMQDATLTWF
jgi:hypothetical protein